ncbi:TfuA-like protein [Streptomyces sp. DT2A-34]|uniref:TfuA-like protein n=1 Tax=Streptomyces sp. DT2A-34 TaxID=3051182 RepID=UPI00265C3D64|nr:TfuA-like protein [Streptomyces sp. DT2A-34]MDO0917761.1 TfuA-like protein [Streptomyces sp. DT2A-34]
MSDHRNTPSPLHVMVGPTGYGQHELLSTVPGVVVHPPAERGSIRSLLRRHTCVPQEIALVDGRFGDVLAVGHGELLEAVDAGWRVWGLGSMGAIRAAELHTLGVIGYGQVFRHLRDTMAPDDEVAVLHGPAPRYRPATEALVDLRVLLAHWAGEGLLSRDRKEELLTELAGRWFGDRSLAEVIALARRMLGAAAADVLRSALPPPARYRIKSRDLATFLQEEPWRQPRRSPSGNSADFPSSISPSYLAAS